MSRKRSAESYIGNTEEMKKNQRANLIPGNAWQRRRIRELRLDCWWEGADLESKQVIFEGCEKGRDIDKVAKDELKEEIELNYWWDSLDIENKKSIYDLMMKELTKEERTPILQNVEECFQKKLANEKG